MREITTVVAIEAAVLTWLAGRYGAPFELHALLLRISPQLDSATEDLEAFAEALAERRNYRRNYGEIRTVSLSEGIGWPYPIVPNCAA
jgi:hypothetical protein